MIDKGAQTWHELDMDYWYRPKYRQSGDEYYLAKYEPKQRMKYYTSTNTNT